MGCHLAVRAFPSDARGLRPRLWLPPDHRGAKDAAKEQRGRPHAAQRVLLRPRLHGMGRGRPLRRSAVRHRRAAVALVPARRHACRAGLLGHGDGQGVVRGGLRDAVQGDPLLPAVGHDHGRGAALAGRGCRRVSHLRNCDRLPGGGTLLRLGRRDEGRRPREARRADPGSDAGGRLGRARRRPEDRASHP